MHQPIEPPGALARFAEGACGLGAGAVTLESSADSPAARSNALFDFFTNYGAYMPRTQCLVDQTGASDWPWIAALIILSAGVCTAYLRIFVFWMRCYFAEERRDRNPKLFDLACIFLLCACCGYLMSVVMFFWPGYRLLAIMLAALNAVTWKFCLSLDQFRLVFAAGQFQRRLHEAASTREAELERLVQVRTAEVARLAEIARRTANAVVITDVAGRIEWVNPGFTRVTGYTLDEVRGRTPGSILQGPNTDRNEVARIRESLQAGRAITAELHNYNKEGREYVIRLEIEPLHDDSGNVTGFMAIESDVTDQRAAERELQQRAVELERLRDEADRASRSKSEFLANMSHEIRTPLTAILGFADLLAEEKTSADPRARAECVSTIKRAGDHLLLIINDILDLSKIEAQKLTIARTETHLCELIGDVAELMRPRAAEKGVDLKVEWAGPIYDRIISDPLRLRQILLNLVGNAAKFTAAGRVTIRAEIGGPSSEPMLTVDIIDTGPGMTAEQASRLFSAFSQVDQSVTRSHGGTGLGLTICRRLARLMGGDVRLLTTAPGKGSTFRAELPVEPAPGARLVTGLELPKSEPQAAPSQQQAPAAPLEAHILLAEDGPDNQRLICHYLRAAGARVEVAVNGRDAISRFEAARALGDPFDLILTDIQMPEMDGYTLIRQLRLRGVRTPIVALTAHAMHDDLARCKEAGCNEHLSKPVDRAALLNACRMWTSQRDAAAAA
ncbi:MAG: ATP-binding protein [Planctomycetota bacterium]|nr:ATP-binding protein [Planctomycetota bacterium]